MSGPVDRSGSSRFVLERGSDKRDSASSYKSSSGKRRTVRVLPKDIEKLMPRSMDKQVTGGQINAMREAVAGNFGDEVANTAFRQIDYRNQAASRGIGRGVKPKKITGRHLATAVMRSLELASPVIKAKNAFEQLSPHLDRLNKAKDESKRELAQAEKTLDRLYQDQNDKMDHDLFRSDEITRTRDRIKELKTEVIPGLRSAIGDTTRLLDEARTTFMDHLDDPLSTSDFGKAQKAVDGVGSDPRFQSLLNDKYARGKMDHGISGSMSRLFSKKTAKTAGTEGLGYLLPPVGVGMGFYKSIKAEDRQRRLAAASAHMNDRPFAKALATNLSSQAEVAKWKHGIGATVGFVGMGATVHIGPLALPGIGLISGSAAKATTKSIEIGSRGVATKVTGTVVGKSVGYSINRTGVGIGSKGVKTIALKEMETGERQELAEDHLTVLPPGHSLPVIPVPMRGDARTKEFDLGTTEVTSALLHHLAAPVDPLKIQANDQNEIDRRDLRRLCGADDTENLATPSSETKKQNKEIIDALDNPTSPKSKEILHKYKPSPLRLLFIGNGWSDGK